MAQKTETGLSLRQVFRQVYWTLTQWTAVDGKHYGSQYGSLSDVEADCWLLSLTNCDVCWRTTGATTAPFLSVGTQSACVSAVCHGSLCRRLQADKNGDLLVITCHVRTGQHFQQCGLVVCCFVYVNWNWLKFLELSKWVQMCQHDPLKHLWDGLQVRYQSVVSWWWRLTVVMYFLQCQLYYCRCCPGIWWRNCWAGFTEWRLIQRQHTHHAAFARQPHGKFICYLSVVILAK